VVNEHLSRLNVPADDYFIWITGEGKVVKNLSARFETEAFDQQLVRATAYWHQRR
jgi:ferric-chelate reductase (NADPH)